MKPDLEGIKRDLVSEIGLSVEEAGVFLLITTGGKMTPRRVSELLGITEEASSGAISRLVGLGGLIEISNSEFEAMHPRFTAVNMYRRACQRDGIEFKRNKVVDNMGAALEEQYDDARTK